MSHPPEQPRDSNKSGEHHSNVSDESRPTLNSDLEPSEATDKAQDERLEILIESDLAS
jgi:hypothetical protein